MNIKCYCGNKISYRIYKDIIARLDEVASNLREGECSNLSFQVDCSCGSNIIVDASVCIENGIIKKEIIKWY